MPLTFQEHALRISPRFRPLVSLLQVGLPENLKSEAHATLLLLLTAFKITIGWEGSWPSDEPRESYIFQRRAIRLSVDCAYHIVTQYVWSWFPERVTFTLYLLL